LGERSISVMGLEKCSECGQEICECDKNDAKKFIVNVNFPIKCPGYTGDEWIDLDEEYDVNDLSSLATTEEINIRTGSKKNL
jgi:hypothetical protein